jgi:hypothetical protein
LPPEGLKPVDKEEWLSRFPGMKDVIREAMDELNFLRPRKARADAFIKQENAITYTAQQDKIESDARLIQGRDPTVKGSTGPQTLAIHKYFRKAYQGDVPVAYGPGLTAEGLGEWYTDAKRHVLLLGATAERELRKRTGIARSVDRYFITVGGQTYNFRDLYANAPGEVVTYVGTLGDESTDCERDASRWDAHCHPAMMAFIAFIYEQLMPDEKTFIGEMYERATRRRTGVTKLRAKYSVDGTVQSGDGDTTGGNTFCHLAMKMRCLYMIIRHVLGISGLISHELVMALPYRAIVMGDDDAEVSTTQFMGLIPRLFERMGTMAGHKLVTEVRTPYTLEFCSGLFYPFENGSHVFGPKVGRVLAKTFYSRTSYNRTKQLRWVRGVCKSLEKASSMVPVLRVIVRQLLHLTAGHVIIHDKQTIRHFETVHFHEADSATMHFVEQRYGFTQAQVLALEKWLIDNVTDIPCVVEHPMLTRMLEVDT